jgi:hypothetical protein
MRVFNHELTVRRNETFTLDKIIQNRDGSPYIITSEMQNPYFVITVSSTLYPTDDGYVYHAWLPYGGPRFHTTVPINIGDFTNKIGDKLYPNGFETLPGLLSGYINGKSITFEPDDALFYYEDASGNRTYKYPYYEFDGKDSYTFKEWRDYECRIIHKFLQQYTRDWIEHSYYYNIELVDGSKEEVPEGEVLDGRPLTSISEVIPILEPTKMSVLSNLKGGMRWK